MKGRILIAATRTLTSALAAASLMLVAAAQAADPSPTTQPGFVPDAGQINPGHAAATVERHAAAAAGPTTRAGRRARRTDDARQWRSLGGSRPKQPVKEPAKQRRRTAAASHPAMRRLRGGHERRASRADRRHDPDHAGQILQAKRLAGPHADDGLAAAAEPAAASANLQSGDGRQIAAGWRRRQASSRRVRFPSSSGAICIRCRRRSRL